MSRSASHPLTLRSLLVMCLSNPVSEVNIIQSSRYSKVKFLLGLKSRCRFNIANVDIADVYAESDAILHTLLMNHKRNNLSFSIFIRASSLNTMHHCIPRRC